jgi:hypothetical protein
MEMNSHQKVPLSQAVANTQPSQAPRAATTARRGGAAPLQVPARASDPRSQLPDQHRQAQDLQPPGAGHCQARAIEAACASPASRTDAVGSRRARIRARTPQRAVAGNYRPPATP